MISWLTALAVFAGIFTQSLTGFGLALVMMPILVSLLGIQIAAPLVALIAALAEISLLIQYRKSLNIKAVWRVSIASFVTIPLGVFALQWLDEKITTTLLGVLLIGYALYALANLTLPTLEHPIWGYSFGLVAGFLSGAYNTPGPAIVIYGNCRRWQPAEFKSNLQGFFLLNSAMVLISHFWHGNISSDVWHSFLIALPAIVLGLWLGVRLDSFINPGIFRKLVLVVLIILGLQLAF
ncbi:MAG: sulfite exporter TauE/SafE family protein [Chloroflexi bacterium]|nr:sulfite exporter TauE/SafE family protein [Chloroflexota bacterium]